MKKTIYILAILGLVLGACDKIEEPYLKESGSTGPDPAPVEKVRKIILEEFTGHLCINCPTATELAQDVLKPLFGDQLVLMSIHAGALSVPGNPPYDVDYRTAAGTAIFNFYNPIGVPTALINRTPYENETTMTKDKWENAIQELIDLPPEAYIEIETEYNDATRELDLHIHTEFLQDLSFPCNLSVFITESGMISAQKNTNEDIGAVPDILDYEHKHVLRQAVNGTWGELLAENPLNGSTLTKDYSLTVSNSCNANNLSVIALVINANTYEVVQAEEIHLH